MERTDPGAEPRFYFSLPRLLARLSRGNATRVEKNALEAWIGGIIFYLISYLFAAHLVVDETTLWKQIPLLILVAFLIWLFWLLVLYINSVIIKLLRAGGLFRTVPTRHAQSILLGITTTALAYGLVTSDSWMRSVGIIWMVAVAINLAAAFLLFFIDADRSAER